MNPPFMMYSQGVWVIIPVPPEKCKSFLKNSMQGSGVREQGTENRKNTVILSAAKDLPFSRCRFPEEILRLRSE